jgi:hypothetical protein
MKKPALSLFSILLLPALLSAGAAPKPNPADFTVLVHVVFSRSITQVQGGSRQELRGTVDGQEVELTSYSTSGVLRPGDYKARLLPNLNGPKHPNFFDEFVGYDLLLPDGTTRDFALTGLGRKGDVISPPR